MNEYIEVWDGLILKKDLIESVEYFDDEKKIVVITNNHEPYILHFLTVEEAKEHYNIILQNMHAVRINKDDCKHSFISTSLGCDYESCLEICKHCEFIRKAE